MQLRFILAGIAILAISFLSYYSYVLDSEGKRLVQEIFALERQLHDMQLELDNCRKESASKDSVAAVGSLK